MTATTRDILVRGRQLIEDPRHWTKGRFARYADGQEAFYASPEATCWCSLGAVFKAAWEFQESRYDAHSALQSCLGGKMTVGQFNDRSTHAEVLGLFDRAINLVEST